MYVLSDEIYKLLKFDVLKIIDSAIKQTSPYKPQDHLQNECDYFAQSFVNPQDYFFFRFRKMYLKIVLTRKTYHIYCEFYRPRSLPQSVVTASHYLAKNLFGDFEKLLDAFRAFSDCVIDIINTELCIPHHWEQLELF